MPASLTAAWRKPDGKFRTYLLGPQSLDDGIDTAKHLTRDGETLVVVRDVAQRPMVTGEPYALSFSLGGARIHYRREGEPNFSFDYVSVDPQGKARFPIEVDGPYGAKALVVVEIDFARAFKFQNVFKTGMARFDDTGDGIAFNVVDDLGRVTGTFRDARVVAARKAVEWRPADDLDAEPEAGQAGPRP